MSNNQDKENLNNEKKEWAKDIKKSVSEYNKWFTQNAPNFLDNNVRLASVEDVKNTFTYTNDLKNITPEILKEHPEILRVLRTCTFPPLAKDRLIGLSGASTNLVNRMEKNIIPKSFIIDKKALDKELKKIVSVIVKMIDKRIFGWLLSDSEKSEQTGYLNESRDCSISIIADRLSLAMYDTKNRNIQEEKQFKIITEFFEKHGYKLVKNVSDYKKMEPGSFAMHVNIPTDSKNNNSNVTVDVAVLPKKGKTGDLPVLIETKSAGDYTNVNKRRKEEADKMKRLQETYGNNVNYCLFLSGYFDEKYLSYECSTGIKCVWEHRINDFLKKKILS